MARHIRLRINDVLESIKQQGINLEISTYAPGDGWRRYGVKDTNPNGITEFDGMSAAECLAYLIGINKMVWAYRVEAKSTTFEKGARVEYRNDPSYRGVIRSLHLLGGVTVVVVDWDGDPDIIPGRKFHSSVSGYATSELRLI